MVSINDIISIANANHKGCTDAHIAINLLCIPESLESMGHDTIPMNRGIYEVSVSNPFDRTSPEMSRKNNQPCLCKSDFSGYQPENNTAEEAKAILKAKELGLEKKLPVFLYRTNDKLSARIIQFPEEWQPHFG